MSFTEIVNLSGWSASRLILLSFPFFFFPLLVGLIIQMKICRRNDKGEKSCKEEGPCQVVKGKHIKIRSNIHKNWSAVLYKSGYSCSRICWSIVWASGQDFSFDIGCLTLSFNLLFIKIWFYFCFKLIFFSVFGSFWNADVKNEF